MIAIVLILGVPSSLLLAWLVANMVAMTFTWFASDAFAAGAGIAAAFGTAIWAGQKFVTAALKIRSTHREFARRAAENEAARTMNESHIP